MAKCSPINLACAKYGKTKTDLAKCLGVTNQTISNWVAGRSSPTLFQVEMMAAFFGITLIEFIKLGIKK